MDIRLENISKQFEGHAALQPTTLDIPSGQLVALLGPSGSGKTTLLRLIAGLLPVDAGRIVFAGRDATRLSLRERQVGFVFQHYALFRHMTVFENVAFGLRVKPRSLRPSEAQIKTKVHDLLKLVQLDWLADRFPSQLSGGQRQRIALARALAVEPKVLLLDEPFGALDAKVRIDLRRWLRRLHEQTGQTTLFVTHDQEEALELADRVVVLREGRIEQVGTPDEIYSAPASEYVFDFIGRANALEGRVEAGRFIAAGQSQAFVTDIRDGAARLYVRPHDLAIAHANAGWPARVVAAHRLADRITLELDVDGQARPLELDFAATPDVETPSLGQVVAVEPLRYRVYPA